MTEDIQRPVPAPPIHPLAAFVTIILDGFFAVFEVLDPFLMFVSSGVIGLMGFLSVTMVQRHIAKDEWGVSIAKGLVMGIVAGVPYPVVGTAVGTPLLVWAGLHQWIKLPASKQHEKLPPPQED